MTTEEAGILAALIGTMAGWVGYIWKVRPKIRRALRRASAFVDVWVGRGEKVDEVSGRKLPAIPPLHERLLTQDLAFAKQDNRLDRIETALDKLTDVYSRLEQHERRIVDLENGTLERAAIRLEAAAALNAVDKLTGDLIDVQPEPDEQEQQP